MKIAGIAVGLFCVASLVPGSVTMAGSSIPDIVQRAAAANASAMNGVLVEERHVQFNASAGPAHFSQQNDAIVMLQDGEYKHVRYLRIVENGKALPSEKLAERESENNAELDHGKSFFKQPFDAHYLHDYTFADATCTCSPRERAVSFKSLIRDDQHGDGTMIVDSMNGHVVSVTYTPNVLPNRASSGTTTETFGEAAPGMWTIIAIDREYSGHVAFIRGNGKMTERMDHFQRFPDTVSGLQFLQRALLL